MERNYEFRKRLLTLHQPDLRRPDATAGDDLVELDETYVIAIPEQCGRVLLTAALDLQDYLFRSMRVSVAVKRYADLRRLDRNAIALGVGGQVDATWEGTPVPGSFAVRCERGAVTVCGFDERGCAQGCYHLEDRMNQLQAPFLRSGRTVSSPAFSPRMVHSGYGLDQYPDAHLAAIAHAGMDAILVFAKGVDETPTGYLDFNELVYRAAGYGLDVYAYIYFESDLHPDDEGAFAYYDGTYGRLFRHCPGLKGMVLVGESVEFPSRDPRVSKKKYYDNTEDGLDTGKPTAGWFPCEDYHKWVRLLQRVVRQYSPDADIVFWTYNWGYAKEEDRLKLIDSLPRDISLMVTFEMFEPRVINGLEVSTVDYTLSFPGPGTYFRSEARRAKERGIRLYAQANSAGLTWDFGVIPYEPCPMQWVRRYEALLEARESYGLTGIMESHHYGFWPSFISEIEKQMFCLPGTGGREAVAQAAQRLYGAEHAAAGLRAWDCLSRAITSYVPTNEDQYGPFRVGPAYPMVFRSDVQIPTVPYALFGGNKICFTEYASDTLYRITSHTMGNTGLVQQRIPGELNCLSRMLEDLRQGRTLLEAVGRELSGWRQEACARLVGLVQFMENSTVTVIHVKQWNLCKWRVRTETDSAELARLLRRIIAIGQAEIENAADTIPLVEADSRLGWEPSMEYIADAAHLKWKIRQTRQVIEEEIPRYLRAVEGA